MRLRILATTDLHMALRGFDYHSDRPRDGIGLARIATLVRAARDEVTGAVTLLLDNGDLLQGTPLDEPAWDDPDGHILPRCLGALGFDAVGLGNHDFNFGLAALDRAIAQMPCPVLCANARRRDWRSFGTRPGVLITRQTALGPLRIGLLSVLPPQTEMWDAAILQGALEVTDILPAARATAADLRRQGADLVVALAHTGLGAPVAQPGQENALLALARDGGFDALIGGHTHLLIPNADLPDGSLGKPVVMPGAMGSHLGVMDLTLHQDAGGWRVTDTSAHLRPTDGVPEDAGVLALTQPLHDRARAALALPVGRTAIPLHSHFCFIARSAALAVVAEAQRHALRDFDTGGLPLLSAVAPGKMGGRGGPDNYTDVPAGPISLRHLTDLCVYPNQLCVVELDGAAVIDWLEMAVSLYQPIKPGGGVQPLLDPDWSGHGFDVIHGLRYGVDLTRPARFDPEGRLRDPDAHRIAGVWTRDRPLRPDDRVLVATNTYRADGGGHVAALRNRPRRMTSDLTLRGALQAYLASGHVPQSQPDTVFRFLPIHGARLELPTGPNAAAYLDELDGRAADLSAPGPDGFRRLRLEA